jgi:hypothetical protein
MRSVLKLTMLAVAFAIMVSFGTFAPTHEVSADGTVVIHIPSTLTWPLNAVQSLL